MANPSPITIDTLLYMYQNTVHPPVATAEAVALAIDWFNIVEVYCIENPDQVPNGNSIIFYCDEYARNTKQGDTEYAKINNWLYHIRSMLYAITQQEQ